MKLKSLNIEKFKTFENIKIPFNSHLNVIVGPNCAGKTILIEALLFSLGEQTQKSGSFAETEIIVGRTIFKRIEKEQDSSYFINGKKKTRREYLKNLKKLGLECNFKNMYVEGFFDVMRPDAKITINDKINLNYPFYIYDDFDSRLDRKHEEKFFKNLKNKNKQFIVVTHRDSIICIANQIYGISMKGKKSKIVSLEV